MRFLFILNFCALILNGCDSASVGPKEGLIQVIPPKDTLSSKVVKDALVFKRSSAWSPTPRSIEITSLGWVRVQTNDGSSFESAKISDGKQDSILAMFDNMAKWPKVDELYCSEHQIYEFTKISYYQTSEVSRIFNDCHGRFGPSDWDEAYEAVDSFLVLMARVRRQVHR